MNLQEFLPYQLSVLSNKVSAGIAKHYRQQHGISIPEWRVLALLSDIPQQTAKELSAQSQMDKVRISRTMKLLEGKHLILEKTCSHDARSRRYSLTKQGLQLIDAVKPKAMAFEKQLLKAFSKEEIKFFNRCLKTLNQQADKIIQENP
jgi:DNA-binding MarR family transcriptional regulator